MASNLRLWLEEGKALAGELKSKKLSKKAKRNNSKGTNVSWRKRDKEGNIVPQHFNHRPSVSRHGSTELPGDICDHSDDHDDVPSLDEHLQRLRDMLSAASVPDPVAEEQECSSSVWTKRQSCSEQKFRAAYPNLLNTLLAAERVTKHPCQQCQTKDAVIRCLECVPSGAQFFCASCDRIIHVKHCFHDREAMLDGFYQPIPPTTVVIVDKEGQHVLHNQVCLLPISKPAQICPCGPGQDFTVVPGKQTVLVTINGQYYVYLPVVCCPLCTTKWTPTVEDLIVHRIWPGTTACQLLFKFDVLTSYEQMKLASPALSLEAFIKILEHRAHSTGRMGSIGADAFHKASREFAFCTFKKEELCLQQPFKCHGCEPEMLAISADGNRKQYRYKKSKGTDEPPLFEGVFIAPDAEVSTFVDDIRSQMITKSGRDTCGPATFAAGRETSTKSRSKVDEEGLEIAVCRHGVLLRGLNHYRGEIYAYPMYLQKELSRTTRTTFFCMDIACRYWPYLEKMAERMPDLQPLTNMKPFLSVMHAKAHTGKCEVKWGGRSQHGAGNTVGEEVEQVNSFLSRAALTTKYMTKSGRVDMITVLAMEWNKRKNQGLHKTLATRFAKTTLRAQNEAANLEQLRQDHSISSEDTEQWVLDVQKWAVSEEHATCEGLQKDIEELIYSIKRKKHELYRQNDSNKTRQRRRKQIAELKKKLSDKVNLYNAKEGDTLDTERLLGEDVMLPWEAEDQGVTFRLKRQVFDQVMLVRRLEEEKIVLVKEMTQHCQWLRRSLESLENLLQKPKEEISKYASGTQLTEDGYRGLLCCLLHKRNIQRQRLKTAISTYAGVESNASFLWMEEEQSAPTDKSDISSSEDSDEE